MCRHVVAALERVPPVGGVLADRVVEPALEVGADLGAGVLVQRQRGRRVEDLEVEEADVDLAQLGERLGDLAGDEVEAAWPGVEADLTLRPHRSALRDANPAPANRRPWVHRSHRGPACFPTEIPRGWNRCRPL